MADRELSGERHAACQCGHSFSDSDAARIAVHLRRHIQRAHPDKKAWTEEEIRRAINKG